MTHHELEQTARALIADGKGILAADETVPTLTKRFAALKIESTEDSRRAYREMFFTTPDIAKFISGAILQDETIRQKNASGKPLAEVLSKQGIIPGIKVDTGAKELAGSPDEKVTEGLDGLRDRLKEYATMGARFAKWRAVIRITDALPSPMCVSGECPRAGPVRCSLPGARYCAYRGTRDSDGWVSYDRTLRGGHQFGTPCGLSRALRAVCQAGRDAPQAEHGDFRQGMSPAGFSR